MTAPTAQYNSVNSNGVRMFRRRSNGLLSAILLIICAHNPVTPAFGGKEGEMGSLAEEDTPGRSKRDSREHEARGAHDVFEPVFSMDTSPASQGIGFAVDIVVVRCDEDVAWLNDWVNAAEEQGDWHIKNVFIYEKCCQMPVEVAYSSTSQKKATPSRSPEKDVFPVLESFATNAHANVRSFCTWVTAGLSCVFFCAHTICVPRYQKHGHRSLPMYVAGLSCVLCSH
jgi:hypothetical protein